VYSLMTASTSVALELAVPVPVDIGSAKSMVFKFPTDEECLTYISHTHNIKFTLHLHNKTQKRTRHY